MNRPRRNNRHLPPCVYPRHGAFWLVKRGKWTRLGKTLPKALEAYAALYVAKDGTMPALIRRVLESRRAAISPNTYRQYATAADKLCKVFADFRPEQVESRHVGQVKQAMVGTPNMANRCLSFLRVVMAQAVEDQLIPFNPCVGIRRHHERKRDRLLTWAEYEAIHAAATPRLRAVMDLCYLTGQRIGDVLAIKRADVTAEGIRFRQAKTGTPLVVDWSPELRDAVDRAKALGRNVVALTLFYNRRGKAPDYKTVYGEWRRAVAAAGVADARIHDLRALSGTEADRQGQDAQSLLGHTSASMTARYLRDKSGKVVKGPTFRRSIGRD